MNKERTFGLMESIVTGREEVESEEPISEVEDKKRDKEKRGAREGTVAGDGRRETKRRLV